MYSLDEFIRKNDTDDKIKKAIANCITENMSRELALDILAEDLQVRLYEFIDSSEELSIDDGSNVRRDFTNAIRDILLEYFKGGSAMISADNMKMVVIINGRGGVGKDTLCNIISKHYDVMNISSIDPIKQIAFANGWNGEKNEKTRKFLADLKRLFIEINDLPTKYLMSKYSEFLHNEKQILFMQIREPEEIEKIKKILGDDCVTLLICGRTALRKTWGNAPDDEVDNYTYDFYYKNSKPLDVLEQDFLQFFQEMIDLYKKEEN